MVPSKRKPIVAWVMEIFEHIRTHLGRIVVVDADGLVRSALRSTFEMSGVNVTVVGTAFDALRSLMCAPVDLLIADYKLADLNGIDLIDWATRNSPNTVCILMLGVADSDTLSLAKTAGARATLEKPLTLDKLSDTLDRALSL